MQEFLTLLNNSAALKNRFLFALFALWISHPELPRCAVHAQDVIPRVELSDIRIGFDGSYKSGHWTPVWVTVRATNASARGRLQFMTADGNDVQMEYIDRTYEPIELAAGESVTALRYLRTGGVNAEITVAFVGESGKLGERRILPGEIRKSLPATKRMIVTLGSSIGLEDALRTRVRHHADKFTTVQIESPEMLPDRWFGFDAVDTVVLPTSSTSVLERASPEQQSAFDRWLRLGGRLILSAGARGDEVFAAESPLQKYAPGGQVQTFSQRDFSGLENYVGAKQALDSVGGTRTRRFSLPMTAVDDVRGVIEVSEVGGPFGRVPAIVRFPYGFGEVVFLAFDLDQPPFTQWESRPVMAAKVVFDDLQDRPDDAAESRRLGPVTHVGYDDLAGQLRGALDQFPGVTRIEFSWVAGLLVAYIALIGPFDYFVVRRLGRPHLTWVTFPLMVMLFCAVGLYLAGKIRGQRVSVNQLNIVDVDVETDLVRGSSWTHLYSPRSRKFDLRFESTSPVPGIGADRTDQLFAWQGLPGTGMGGLESTANTAMLGSVFSDSYDLIRTADNGSPSMRIEGMPVAVSSSRSLTAAWWEDVELVVDGQLTKDSNGQLRGEVTYPLNVPLTECMMFFENWAYRLTGSVMPGQTLRFDGLAPLHLEWRLTRRRVVETKDVSTPWNEVSVDVARIAEVMMFHRAAGGESYTKLGHRYHGRLDLSKHLRKGRAILVGRSDQPAGRVLGDDRAVGGFDEQYWTFYRIAYPVEVR